MDNKYFVRICAASYTAQEWIDFDNDMYDENDDEKNGLILKMGELGYETDTGRIKIGDSSTRWSNLKYYTSAGAAGSKAFTIKNINSNNKTFILDSVDGLEVNDVYSCHISFNNGSRQYENYGKITNISGLTVTVDNFPTWGANLGSFKEENDFLDANGADTELNTFRIVNKPNIGTRRIGYGSFAVGVNTYALSKGAVSFGKDNISYGSYAYTEGMDNKAGYGAHAEGRQNEAKGSVSHAEGQETIANGVYSHTEGYKTITNGQNAHAEGKDTIATGDNSHAEGEGGYRQDLATQKVFTTEGSPRAEAAGANSHVEGKNTHAAGQRAHAEGYGTYAEGISSHTEGHLTYAKGQGAHAEGGKTKAEGNYAHAEGIETQATGQAQHVQGQYNVINNDMVHIVGWGGGTNNRKNIHTLDASGNAVFRGDVYANASAVGCTQDSAKKLATVSYVDGEIDKILGSNELNDTFDTLKEIQDWILGDGVNTTELTAAIAEETKTRAEQDNALQQNIDKKLYANGWITNDTKDGWSVVSNDIHTNISSTQIHFDSWLTDKCSYITNEGINLFEQHGNFHDVTFTARGLTTRHLNSYDGSEELPEFISVSYPTQNGRLVVDAELDRFAIKDNVNKDLATKLDANGWVVSGDGWYKSVGSGAAQITTGRMGVYTPNDAGEGTSTSISQFGLDIEEYTDTIGHGTGIRLDKSGLHNYVLYQGDITSSIDVAFPTQSGTLAVIPNDATEGQFLTVSKNENGVIHTKAVTITVGGSY